MGYVKAVDVLPLEVVEQIQEYISGEVIYIPKKKGTKEAWGEKTAIKAELAKRNADIYAELQKGIPVSTLANKYFLVEKSIQRIVRQEKKKV